MSWHPRAGLVFPGQGSQKPDLLSYVPENDTFERLIDAAEALSGLKLREISLSGDPAALADTRAAQPLLYLTDWGWGVALMDVGVEPAVLAGHSLGEFAALATAGVFSPEAGLELVIERSKLMADAAAAAPGTMAAVLGMDNAAIAAAIEGIDGVWVANDNSPAQVVISGLHDGVARATEVLTDAGARRVIPLDVAGAFHSPLMEPARSTFADILSATEFRDASIPVIQNTSAVPSTDAEVIRANLAAQITAPVRWTETMHALTAQGPIVLIETGPGTVLRGLARGISEITAVSVEDTSLETIVEEVLAREASGR